MDVTGLILLLGLLLLGAGLYVAMFRNKIAKKPTPPETMGKHEVYHEEPEVHHKEPEVYHKEPEVYHKEPEVHHKEPEVYHKEPEVYHKKPEVLEEQGIYPAEQLKKYETSIEFFPDIVFPPDPVKEHVPDLPQNYNDTNITLMARDPETLYAYWEVSEQRKNNLKETYGSKWDNATPVIRFYDVTGVDYFDGKNANSYTDVVINNHADSWYAHIASPDRMFCAALGRKLHDGTFVTIARSNNTYTPRNKLSDKVDPKWMMVSMDQKKLYDRIGNVNGISSYELFERD